MDIGPVLFLLLAVIRTTLSYREYSASRMPDYDLDYDNIRESRKRSEYSTEKIRHDDDDYRYDDEGENPKPLEEFYIADTITHKPKRLSPKTLREDIDTDSYNDEELQQESTGRKTFRHRTTEFDSEEDNRKIKYNPNHNIENVANKEYYPSKGDDYKENNERETTHYNNIEFINRKARRKPRDRPIKINLPENELDNSSNEKFRRKMRKDTLQRRSDKEDIAKGMLNEAFDDLKRANNFNDNLPLIIRQPVNMTEFSSPSHLEILPYRRADEIHTTPNPFNISQTLSLPVNMSTKTDVANKTELTLAERSRLSILKKVLKKENSNTTKTTKPPILMQVTNNMQTVVMVESNNLQNEIKKVRRVMDDSPEVLNRAKHLMRQKLIARAGSIEDLTNNWDEMVCDYIDLNLLNSAASRTKICLIILCCNLFVTVVF